MFTLTIKTDNAAFDTEGGNADRQAPAGRNAEVARILREVATALDDGRDFGTTGRTILDSNGNTVGRARFGR